MLYGFKPNIGRGQFVIMPVQSSSPLCHFEKHMKGITTLVRETPQILKENWSATVTLVKFHKVTVLLLFVFFLMVV